MITATAERNEDYTNIFLQITGTLAENKEGCRNYQKEFHTKRIETEAQVPRRKKETVKPLTNISHSAIRTTILPLRNRFADRFFEAQHRSQHTVFILQRTYDRALPFLARTRFFCALHELHVTKFSTIVQRRASRH